MTTFAELVVAHLDEAFELDPLLATAAGVHDHDDRWPDFSAAGRTRRLAWIEGWETCLRGFDISTLTADEAIDRGPPGPARHPGPDR